ncbi:hypothetical protein [Phytohabitans kaempferiae]|uniref:Class I SAM-dependent methyltransferase n=1 Tax=Phytohabitans kaempferiae TaxID=1620943 RepID=A0ABV6M0X0_9ACTN
MTRLVLTPERRAQLVELLSDERRLEAEYPQVAEYLNTAPGLAGTGDDEADRAFDFRMLNYMTGGKLTSDNPYWDIVAPAVTTEGGRRVANGGRPQGSARLAYAQTVLQAGYAYAIPSPETIGWAARFCEGKPLIEIGAGRGYWAAQLSYSGLRVDAYDVEPPDRADNESFPRVVGQTDVWHHVGNADEANIRMQNSADSVLFLCWPPGWDNPMASEALTSFERAGGAHLIYVGEPRGGKTANNTFFDALDNRWQLESVDEQFVSWWNLADTAQGWIRRS